MCEISQRSLTADTSLSSLDPLALDSFFFFLLNMFSANNSVQSVCSGPGSRKVFGTSMQSCE